MFLLRNQVASHPKRISGDRHVILGLWPIAGITTVGVTAGDAEATILAAIDAGVTCFDTAYSYGFGGECDRLLGTMIRGQRDRFRVIGKVGQRWNDSRQRVIDGSAATLAADAEASLRRSGIERFDLLMLHSPDPEIPIETSAGAMNELRARGLCTQIGVCNADAGQRRRFAAVADCAAVQCPLNLRQRDSLLDLIPDAESAGCEVHVYWTLMKGLLAGQIKRDHQFAAGDVRPGYEIFQGEQRRRTHAVLDRIGELGQQCGRTIAQLSIGWALSQPGVTAALVGARRPDQIIETASSRPLGADLLAAIESIVAEANP